MEARVRQDLSRLAAGLAAELGDDLDALMLVGAYARGEGGVVEGHAEPSGYPGYRCLLLTARRGLPTHLLRRLEESWSSRLEIGIHLATVATSALPKMPANLWWLDIARGNVEILTGDPQVLQGLPALDVTSVPPIAAGWLLADAALSIAVGRLTPGVAPLDRLRHLHCASIACGDARVLLSGRFGGTMRARRAQLEALAPPQDLLAAYSDAIEFLGRPDRWQPGEGSREAWEDQILAQIGRWHLDFEAKRLGTPASVDGFARYRPQVYGRAPASDLRAKVGSAIRQVFSATRGFPYLETPHEVVPRAAVSLAYGADRPSSWLMAARLLGVGSNGAPPTAARLVDALESQAVDAHGPHARLFQGSFYGPVIGAVTSKSEKP